jgi:hypothetical protein
MFDMDYGDNYSQITKNMILFNDEDYEKIAEKEELQKFIVRKSPKNRLIVLSEEFNDNKCAACGCPTIANIVDEFTNKFILQCVACSLKFDIGI